MASDTHITSYRQLVVWQKSMALVKEVYRLTDRFPEHERFGLTSQMRRAAVAIPSNIAEGFCRSHQREFKQFLSIAYGSGAELETQIEICKTTPDLQALDYTSAESLLGEVMKMLNTLIRNIKKTN